MNKAVINLFLFLLLFQLGCHFSDQPSKRKSVSDSIIYLSSWVYNDSLDRELALKKMEELLKKRKNIPTIDKYHIYGGISYYHFIKGELTKASLYNDSMIRLVDQPMLGKKYMNELARAYYSKGDILFKMGHYDESYKHYFYAKKLIDQHPDKCLSSDYSYRIAMLLFKHRKYAEAGEEFKEALEESQFCSPNFSTIFRRQELYNNIGLSYTKQQLTDSAIQMYEKGLEFIQINDTIPGKERYFELARGVIYGNLGGEYARKKQYKTAEKLLLKSYALNCRPDFDNVDAATANIKLVEIYLETGQLEKARKYLDTLKSDNQSLQILEHEQSYHGLMSRYFEVQHKKDEAFDHLNRFIHLRDSVWKQNQKFRSTDVNERLISFHKENTIDFLERDNRLQQIYLFITVLFSLLVLVITLLIYLFWRRSKRTANHLIQLNDQISHQKEKLEETLVALKQSNRDKDQILRVVAHDLRNPIAGILSLSDLLLKDVAAGDRKDQYHLIKRASESSLSLINELMTVGASGVEPVGQDKTLVNLVDLTEEVVALMRFRAREKFQDILLESSDEVMKVEISRQRITRLIENLLSNAIKFSQEQTTIRVRLCLRETKVEVTVKDEGIGIPEEWHSELFQLFTAARRAGTRGESSFGLGLSICKQIVEAHGGEIRYESNEEGGSSFVFDLPLAR